VFVTPRYASRRSTMRHHRAGTIGVGDALEQHKIGHKARPDPEQDGRIFGMHNVP
jgi:hypothetical protein